ncbi:MAG: hypothetical protein HYU36_01115 [Planctomycetes bacterium]|nr:hypothetical protein [Planctomycetota bacterium]
MRHNLTRSIPTRQRQLFLDDHGIETLENLRRTLHPLCKKGAVIRPDWTIGVDMLQAHATHHWDSEAKRFKFWLSECPNELWEKKINVAGYYESEDGLHWTMPILRQKAGETRNPTMP